MKFSYKFQSSGVWVEAAATYQTESEAENAAKKLEFPYSIIRVYQCTCTRGGRELGPDHEESCNLFTPF